MLKTLLVKEKLNLVFQDNVANSWTNMPNMINIRSLHKSVAVKNKLFLFGGDRTKTCEVYDSTCKKFVLLKPPDSRLINYNDYGFMFPEAAISIGSKIYVFLASESICLIYDVENNILSENYFEVSRNLRYFRCAKIPQC